MTVTEPSLICRRAYCHEQLGDKEQHLEDALKDYQRVLELDANNQQAKNALVRLPQMISDRNERLKAQVRISFFTSLAHLYA